jgi:hypothetical protein
MKSYKMHWINITVIAVFLFGSCHSSINRIINLNNNPFWSWRLPHVVVWCYTLYLLYKVFTTAYKISFLEDGSIKLNSLSRRTTIHPGEILKINSYIMFVDIVTQKGSYSVSSIMEGTDNIKNVLIPLVKDSAAQNVPTGPEPEHARDNNRLQK